MTPRVPYPPRVVWPCRIAPEVLKELQELADWEREYRDTRMNLGKFVERELRETIKRYRRIKP